MGWDDPLMEHATVRRGQLVLAMFAMSVWQGSSIFCRQVKYGTIVNYVNDAASLISMATNRDFRKDQPTDTKFGKILTDVYTEIKRCEQVPNRREPFSPAMLLEAKRVSCLAASSLVLTVALADWWEIALLAGFRLSEWAQPTDHFANPDNVQVNLFGDPAAFCLDDVTIQTYSGCRATGKQILTFKVVQIHKMWIRFRTQKNGDHGETRMFTRNTNSGMCAVAPMFRILTRFVALRGLDDVTTPLALFQPHEKGSVRMITARDIEKHMRRIAATVYKLNPKNKADRPHLQRWSAHSLRVGACTTLNERGFSACQIKLMLRWRSDSFLMYLRNTVTLSDQQNAAWDTAMAMPNLQ